MKSKVQKSVLLFVKLEEVRYLYIHKCLCTHKVYTQEIINSSCHCVGGEDLGSGVETCFLLYAPLYFEIFFFFGLIKCKHLFLRAK